MTWIVALVVIAALAALLFGPWFKGRRTQIWAGFVAVWGGFVPLLTQIIDSLQGLDWRTYVLAGDSKNLTVLAILAVFAVVTAVLRYMTTGPVGEK